ncbi:MAG: hypothetical protein KKF20_00380, partial [Bacteroidetes bacterium]|nr:hypothetical protein [Bacteroidota bacterium]
MKVHDVGKVRQVITNTGWLNAKFDPLFSYPGLINCEYPPGSLEEHITEGGPWVGAVLGNDTLVSVIRGEQGEFYPSDASWDTIWVVKRGDTVDIGDPANPYWKNYVGVSDQDFVCRYNDYNPVSLKKSDHKPLYLEVIQNSYAWGSLPLDEIIVVNYHVISTKYNLERVFLTNWMNGNVGYGLSDAHGLDDETYFDRHRTLAICTDLPGGEDGDAIGPIGQRSYFPEPIAGSVLTFIWYNGRQQGIPYTDVEKYTDMTKNIIMENQVTTGDGTKHIVALGPYQLNKGDTLHFSIALILGKSIKSIYENERVLNLVRAKDFKIPFAPPPPPLTVIPGSKRVTLKWKPGAGDVNPEEYHDPYRGDSIPKPFEGYRVYKSTKSQNGPWTLLAEFDLPDNAYGSNTGIEYEYTDVGLLNNLDYYYAVTSFSKPDKVLNFPPLESSIKVSSKKVVPGTPPLETVGQVAVVPNPYRGDVAYHSYIPPWEKPGGTRDRWMEQDRRIQFINLTAECDIRIYTLSGDLVQTIYHNNPNKGYEDWNLTS